MRKRERVQERFTQAENDKPWTVGSPEAVLYFLIFQPDDCWLNVYLPSYIVNSMETGAIFVLSPLYMSYLASLCFLIDAQQAIYYYSQL